MDAVRIIVTLAATDRGINTSSLGITGVRGAAVSVIAGNKISCTTPIYAGVIGRTGIVIIAGISVI